MKYEIKDDNCSVVICHLKQGEKMISGNDAIAWNDACIKTKTYDPSSIFTSLFNKKNADRKISAALQDGNIAFTVGFPGNILNIIADEHTYTCNPINPKVIVNIFQ